VHEERKVRHNVVLVSSVGRKHTVALGEHMEANHKVGTPAPHRVLLSLARNLYLDPRSLKCPLRVSATNKPTEQVILACGIIESIGPGVGRESRLKRFESRLMRAH
jgi:hypothetical protein